MATTLICGRIRWSYRWICARQDVDLNLIFREEDLTVPPHGHITSLSVMRTWRKLGIAGKLMRQARKSKVNLRKCNEGML